METATKTVGIDAAVTPTVSTWQIDPIHSNVEFSVRPLMISTVRGRMTQFTGEIRLDEADPPRGAVHAEIAAASIDTHEEIRDGHLRSADFLDVSNHPTITFDSRTIEGDSKEGWRVTGDLTMRGVTRPVTLDMTESGAGTDPWGNERRGFSASTVIDRRDFDLVWNQVLDTGGIVLGHHVKITLDVEAVKQPATEAEAVQPA